MIPDIIQLRWLYNSNEYFAMLLSDGTMQIHHVKSINEPIISVKLRIGKYKMLNDDGECHWPFLPNLVDFIFVDRNCYYDLFSKDSSDSNSTIFAYVLLEGGKIYSLIFDKIAMGDDGLMKINAMDIYLQASSSHDFLFIQTLNYLLIN